jgi:hypothetical protein
MPDRDRAVAEEHAGQVDVDHLLPGIDRILDDRRVGTGDARTRHEDVGRRELLLGRREGRFERLLAGDVDLDGDRVTRCLAQGGGGLPGAVEVAVPQGETAAAGGRFSQRKPGRCRARRRSRPRCGP